MKIEMFVVRGLAGKDKKLGTGSLCPFLFRISLTGIHVGLR